jgi:hypothetical protein
MCIYILYALNFVHEITNCLRQILFILIGAVNRTLYIFDRCRELLKSDLPFARRITNFSSLLVDLLNLFA